MKEKSLNLGKTKRADIYPQFTAEINKLGEIDALIPKVIVYNNCEFINDYD